MTRVTLSAIDHDGEGTSTSFNLADLSAANFVAQGVILDDMQAAIQGVSLLAYEGTTYPAYVAARETTKPANGFAQRETKWQVTVSDNVNNKTEQFEIGGANLALLVPGTKFMDVSAGAGLALLTAIETNVRSNAGNNVTVVEIVHVGRSI